MPMLPIRRRPRGIGNWELELATLAILATFFLAPCARAENASVSNPQLFNSQLFNFSTHYYTNHAGNVVSGVVIALDARTVTISNATETAKLPLSIFPESEQRRIAADFVLRRGGGSPGTVRPSGGEIGLLRVPVAVKRAIAGADKAMARSRKRAEKGLCSKEESEAFCARSESALKSYLDRQVKEGAITPAERKALGR